MQIFQLSTTYLLSFLFSMLAIHLNLLLFQHFTNNVYVFFAFGMLYMEILYNVIATQYLFQSFPKTFLILNCLIAAAFTNKCYSSIQFRHVTSFQVIRIPKPTRFSPNIDEKQYLKKSCVLKACKQFIILALMSAHLRNRTRYFSWNINYVTSYYFIATCWFGVKYGEYKITI